MAWQPNYVGISDVQSVFGMDPSNVPDELELAVAAASRLIDQYTGRQFGVLDTAAPRYYEASYDASFRSSTIVIDDLMTTTDLAVSTNTEDGGAYSTALTLEEDYYLAPLNAAADGRPWTMLMSRNGNLPTRRGSVKIVAQWGWTDVPKEVEQAALIQASRLFKRKDAPFGVAGALDEGQGMRLLSRLDPDVELLLRPYRRFWGAV